ncbi:hypothetical protein BT69DRAFT_1344373 [Atractiella rhizophila]|nr:hypothetical protein BT69DRAFT_1344373 [Atractiella rhizophila]
MAGPLTSPVLDVFNIEWQDFPVMEEVAEAKTLDTCDLSEEQKVALAASAVEWLEDQLAVVLDTVCGTNSSVPVSHPFFEDHETPGMFAHFNKLANTSERFGHGTWCHRSLLKRSSLM